MSWEDIDLTKEPVDEVCDEERERLCKMLWDVALGEWDCKEIYDEILSNTSRDRHYQLERIILDNTPCRIAGGFNYQMGDITRKLNRET